MLKSFLIIFILLITSTAYSQPPGICRVSVPIKPLDDGLNLLDGQKRIFTSRGTGFIFDKSEDLSYVLTNFHVVENWNQEKPIICTFNDGSVKAKIIDHDELIDVAVLEINHPSKSHQPFKFCEKPIEVNQKCSFGGMANGFWLRRQTTVKKYLSHGDDPLKKTDVLVVHKTARQGDSGGPILNENNEIVGILYSNDPKANETFGTQARRICLFLNERPK